MDPNSEPILNLMLVHVSCRSDIYSRHKLYDSDINELHLCFFINDNAIRRATLNPVMHEKDRTQSVGY